LYFARASTEGTECPVAQKAFAAARNFYLEALIAQGLVLDGDQEPEARPETQTLAAAYPSSSWAIGPAVLAHRTVAALGCAR
jgi:hypothetical protein